jgi:hypothetical protein
MPELEGGCHCGNLRITAHLTREPGNYVPRACDCDFCRKHGAAYVSDPQGWVSIRVAAEADCSRYRQGSGSAEFLVCRRCGVLVAVLHGHGPGTSRQTDDDIGHGLHATLNVRALSVPTAFAPEQTVSPKRLAAADKVRRWQEVWFADVRLEGLSDGEGDH